MRLGYALVEHGAAAAADQIPQPVAQQAVFFEGDQRLTVLPAQIDVRAPTVLALLNGKLHVLHVRPSFSSSSRIRSASTSRSSPMASRNPSSKLA